MNNTLVDNGRGVISVIVPVYKVKSYLCQCVDSIINQTYKDLEILLVDDGSPDSSGAISDEYATKDERIRVIHKANGGQSTARNAALDVAQGDYIGFVDGDDWVEPNMYESLLSVMLNENADIVQCGWYKVSPEGVKECPFTEQFREHYTSDEGLEELIKSKGGHLNTSVCCKLFKNEVAQKFRFTPVRAYEDDEYIFKTVSIASKIVCVNNPLYNYLNREGSTMTASFNINKLALVTIQKNICELLKTRLPERFNETQKTLCSKQFYILYCLLVNPQIDKDGKEAKALQQSIMDSYEEYMNNPQMGKNRLMLQLLRYTPKWLWRKVLAIKFSGAPK